MVQALIRIGESTKIELRRGIYCPSVFVVLLSSEAIREPWRIPEHVVPQSSSCPGHRRYTVYGTLRDYLTQSGT